MSLQDCPPTFKIVKLQNQDAERDSINAALQALSRCLGEHMLPDPSGHAGEYLSTDGTNVFWAAGGGGGGGQASIQFQDEGSNLGSIGTVDTLNFVGSVAAARVGNTVTVNVPNTAPTTINAPFGFGAGSKGGAPIPVNNADAGGIAAYQYTLGNWRMEVFPSISSGTFTVDIRRAASGAYHPASSICGGSFPTISSGVEASGNSSGFTSNVINPDDAVDAVVTVNTAAVQWWRLVFDSVRPI